MLAVQPRRRRTGDEELAPVGVLPVAAAAVTWGYNRVYSVHQKEKRGQNPLNPQTRKEYCCFQLMMLPATEHGAHVWKNFFLNISGRNWSWPREISIGKFVETV